MSLLKKFFPGGIHPKEGVNGKAVTQNIPITSMVDPDRVIIPLTQHLGAPSVCVVKKGDLVLKGQCIGEAQGYVSADVHASVSGKVVSVDKQMLADGTYHICVTIENDKLHNWIETEPCLYPDGLSLEEFLNKIRHAGIVGLGGAAFPTHVKLNPNAKVDTLIINAAECEPYLSTDNRLLLEHLDTVLDGVQMIQKKLNIDNVIIGIEDNKPEAIKALKNKILNIPNFKVKVLNTMYPQGGEKQLIYACTRRKVKMGSLPATVGVLVVNVATCYAISEAIRTGKPLIDRVLTIAGSVNEPKNLQVLNGTLICDILNACGGLTKEAKVVILGGPMMGMALSSTEVPVTKASSGIVALEFNVNEIEETPCIHCGRCNYSCPMQLSPSEIDRNVRINKAKDNEQLSVMNCIECGICSFVCPAKRQLTQSCKVSKHIVREEQKRRG
ncbi:MAG: electron transport complex subunit RsxC [Eubacteriales bacterium]|nr:electron transport complex subunit RsxC [Eubacteriales bacterium]